MSLQKIRIYTDENVSNAIAEGLRRRGIDAQSCQEMRNHGLTDIEQLDYAYKNGFVIFTHDDDFLTLDAKYRSLGKKHRGIIYAHQREYDIGECIKRLELIVEILTPEEINNNVEFL